MSDWLDTYASEVSSCPTLSDDEIRTLVNCACDGDLNAADVLIRDHLYLVVESVRESEVGGTGTLDAIAEGNRALAGAIRHFPADASNGFADYARGHIRRSFQAYSGGNSRASATQRAADGDTSAA